MRSQAKSPDSGIAQRVVDFCNKQRDGGQVRRHFAKLSMTNEKLDSEVDKADFCIPSSTNDASNGEFT